MVRTLPYQELMAVEIRLGQKWINSFVALLLLSFGGTAVALAQVCQEDETAEALQYLRRLSLDLRGRLPTVEELSSVATNGEVDPAIVRSIVRSEETLEFLREYHRKLLWVNVENQSLSNNDFRLQRNFARNNGSSNAGNPNFTISFGRRMVWRGAGVNCVDEPARFDPQTGEILTTFDAQSGGNREGWVEVEPYWAPGTTVKVCAFEAQDNLTGINQRGRTVDCRGREAAQAKACGCGPNLRWCESRNDFTRETVLRAFNVQLLRFVTTIIRDDRPYSDLLLAKRAEINGPISHYYRHLSSSGFRVFASSDQQNQEAPDISFDKTEEWTSVVRNTRHSGILSLPAFLIKFQTNRARANRFYNAFLCQSFEAPEGGLPAADDDCHQEPNLTKRCGCMHCHQGLEPAAAYWGRWAENGLHPLNEAEFPRVNQNCVQRDRQGRFSESCRAYYLTEPQHQDEEAYLGHLKPYLFADAQQEANIQEGPLGIAADAVGSGLFARCTAKNFWSQLVSENRELSDPLMLSLGDAFAQDYDLRTLIERIVKHPEYIRAGNF